MFLSANPKVSITLGPSTKKPMRFLILMYAIMITMIIHFYLYYNFQYTQKHFIKETNKMKTISAMLGMLLHSVVVTSQPHGT